MKPVRVLIANDSAVVRELLFQVLAADAGLEVIAVVNDGLQAVEATCRLRPDVIAMDSQMPNLDGAEATRRIMERCPAPVVLVSESFSGPEPDEGSRAFHAMEQGAIALVRTPPALDHPDHARAAAELIQTLKLMAEVKVVRRWPTALVEPSPPPAPPVVEPYRVVVIGASAGGPVALKAVLGSLAGDFPLPILIVQHMATGFVGAFARWLRDASAFPVSVAVNGEVPAPGHAYLSPSDRHLGLDSRGRIELADTPPEANLRPAVAHLFRTALHAFGAKAIAVLLSGMGRDGAREMEALRQAGAITIAQDEQSSLVFGMPGEAARLGAAAYVLPPERIAPLLTRLAQNGRSHHG